MSGHAVLKRWAVHVFPLFWAPNLSVWDKHGHGYVTLSYERFLFSPDVFLGEFVILSTWADGSREGTK
jgi:hypothetical protein